MKRIAVNKDAECMACFNCVFACSEAFFKTSDPNLSCIQVTDKKGAAKPRVCVQCGECARVCEHEAIIKNTKGVYIISKKNCVKCGKCVDACPFKVLVRHPESKMPGKCIACGICVNVCPTDVLHIKT